MTKEIDLKEQRKLQVQGLSYIKKICDENEISYFLANGTLLGTVKYNGYIPWDDDIDICLKRKDYIKLLEVMENEKNEEYELLTVYNTKDYYYPYAKLVNKKTRVIENAKEIRKLGVYIDIFPIDYFDEDVMKYYHKIRFVRNMSARRIRIRNNLEKTSFNVKKEKKVHFKFIKNIIYTFVDIVSLPLGYNFWAKYLDKIVSKNACGNYAGVIYINPPKIFSTSLFDSTSEYEFESQMFTSVKDYDCYLSNLYGDYQKDLPEHQRRSHHQIKAYWRDDYE